MMISKIRLYVPESPCAKKLNMFLRMSWQSHFPIFQFIWLNHGLEGRVLLVL